jgi:hypothetical protein
MPVFHKLADGPCTMEVANIEVTEGKFGPQYRFVGTDGTEVYVSEMAGQRGLDRLKLDIESAVGETLTLFQIKKDGKTYTNIEKGGSAAAAAATAATTASPAKVSGGTVSSRKSLEELEELYGKCLDIACNTLVKRCEEFSIPLDGAAVQAATATLFIAAK